MIKRSLRENIKFETFNGSFDSEWEDSVSELKRFVPGPGSFAVFSGNFYSNEQKKNS